MSNKTKPVVQRVNDNWPTTIRKIVIYLAYISWWVLFVVIVAQCSCNCIY